MHLYHLSAYSLPFMHKRGPLGPIHFWVLSRRNYGTKLAPQVYKPKTTVFQQKERSKNVSFQNGGQKKQNNNNNEFSFREKGHVTKIGKTPFPKEVFNKIWLNVKEHKYIYIYEIKFEKICCLKMGAKTSFLTMRNNAHLCLVWKWRGRYQFFFTKRCVTDS